jgi:hypothetical protein
MRFRPDAPRCSIAIGDWRGSRAARFDPDRANIRLAVERGGK